MQQKDTDTTKKWFYIIRHGETDFNLAHKIQGRSIDSDLNDTGRKQALAFYNYYKQKPFDKVYTSSLKRTHQTVVNFTTQKGLEPKALPGLDEMHWGNKNEGKVMNTKTDAQYQRITKAWNAGNTHIAFTGGESPEQVLCRQKLAWEHIMLNKLEKTVLICMHGRALRILLCYLMGLDLSKMDSFPHDNTGLYTVSYDGSNYHLGLQNDTTHLQNLVL